MMSAVHHISPFAMAICIMNAKVSGLTVGLNVWGMGSPALSIFAASWSPRAAPRALCLSGKPLPFFLRLHLSVVPICQYLGIALTSSGVSARKVLVVSMRSVTSLRIASLNCSASGALSASLVDMFSSSASGTVRNSGSCMVSMRYCDAIRASLSLSSVSMWALSCSSTLTPLTSSPFSSHTDSPSLYDSSMKLAGRLRSRVDERLAPSRSSSMGRVSTGSTIVLGCSCSG